MNEPAIVNGPRPETGARPTLKVLLVENSPGDVRAVREFLDQAGGFELHAAATLAGGIAAAHVGTDAVLLALGLPDSTGLDTLKQFVREHPTLPVIVLTGRSDEGIGDKAARSGAQDLIAKQDLTPALLAKSIRHAVERLGFDLSMRQAGRRWRTIFDAVTDGMVLLDADRRILQCNKAFARHAGRPFTEIIGRRCHEVLHGTDTPIEDCPFTATQAFLRRRVKPLSVAGRDFDMVTDPVLDSDGGFAGAVHIITDVTDQRRSEEILRMRLRLVEYAALNTLDDLLVRTLDEICAFTGSPIGFYHFVGADQKTLTLKAVSSRTIGEFCNAQGKDSHRSITDAGVWVDCVAARRPVIRNDYAALPHRKGLPGGHAPVVRELVVPVMRGGVIKAIVGVGNKPTDYGDKDADLVSFLADEAWMIAEHELAEEALLESEVRLAQAQKMEAVGRLAGGVAHDFNNLLSVIISNAEFIAEGFDASDVRRRDADEIIKAARRAADLTRQLLAFSREQIMAPGVLDLNETVRGMDEMPRRVTGEGEPADSDQARHGASTRGTETVLLVEDEAPVRTVAREILKRNGYTVLDTSDPDEAEAICRAREGRIDLLLTDVVMPKIGGPKLAETLTSLRPGMKVLFMSGYTDDSVLRRGVSGGETALLDKPFTPATLSQKVREVLDRKPPPRT